MKINHITILIIIVVFGCNPKVTTYGPTTEVQSIELRRNAKNVILLIGDGMGLTQITAGLYSNNNRLNLERFPIIGLHKSYSSSDLITDSAAGATAFACGVKTYNGAIGVDQDTVPVQTILELSEENGMPTGLVATSTIVHATPASFIAHVKQRKQYEDIAKAFLNTEIDYFVGGGKKYFNKRKDGRNLINELEQKNYVIDDYFSIDFKDINLRIENNFGYFTADGDPISKTLGRDYLVEASKRGAEFLNSKSKEGKGFFLMIEGSQIDWGGHANDSEYIIAEMLDFDEAIGEVLDFAQKDGNTLVVVTADHETGGYALNPGSSMDTIIGEFTSDYPTATLIPVFAYGPGAELFNGIYENTLIYDKMKRALGF